MLRTKSTCDADACPRRRMLEGMGKRIEVAWNSNLSRLVNRRYTEHLQGFWRGTAHRAARRGGSWKQGERASLCFPQPRHQPPTCC